MTTSRGPKEDHELWGVWRRLVGKCHDPKHKQYHCWGALGFRVTPRWLGTDGFWNFVDDMPGRPNGKTQSGRSAWKLELIYGAEWNPLSTRWVAARRTR